MRKKGFRVPVFAVVIVVICLVLSALFLFVEFQKAYASQKLLGQGLALIREHKYEQAIAKCNQMPYRRGICFASLIAAKLENNETVSQGLCLSIPIETKIAFLDFEGKDYVRRMVELKARCLKFANSSIPVIEIYGD
jgi:hypothetical protein